MKRIVLKSKIHRARVTGKSVDYEGSLTLCPELVKKANLVPFERVEVYNITNGQRFSTYLIEGKKGDVILNGAAARLGEIGDLLIIASYTVLEDDELENFKPRIVLL